MDIVPKFDDKKDLDLITKKNTNKLSKTYASTSYAIWSNVVAKNP